jgi:hypothetical protein
VYLRVGEVAQPAGVVEVEVREHHVADVGRGEAQPLDLAQRGLRDVQHRTAHPLPPPGQGGVRIGDVTGPEPAVHEYEAVVGLDQQAVADHLGGGEEGPRPAHQPAAEGAHRRAVEVVDLHAELRSVRRRVRRRLPTACSGARSRRVRASRSAPSTAAMTTVATSSGSSTPAVRRWSATSACQES